MWFVYILQCENGALYTGMTNDLERRFKLHKQGRASRFTRAFKAKKIIYSEKVASRSSALKREAEIKRFSRPQKLQLIRSRKK